MDENFLLKTDGAWKLYQVAKDIPIIDFHNHLSVAEMAADRQFQNLTRLWLTSDPYKHRLMRICGVEEKYITGLPEPRRCWILCSTHGSRPTLEASSARIWTGAWSTIWPATAPSDDT